MDIRILFITDTSQLDRANSRLRETGAAGSRAGSQIEAGMGRAGSAVGGVSSLLAPLSGALATLGLASVATDAMDTYRSFESMQATLKTMTGSTEAASAAFGEIQAFASTTPYSLDQSVQGFTKLKALGLDPSMSSLKSYGNTAAAMGKDLMQMIEAVADASTGEFERLKEFGIKSKVEGDKVAFTFQGVTTKIGNNSKEIQDYLLKIGNTTFATAMSDQANTLNGKISNLKDNWAALQVKIIEQTGSADLAKASVAALAGVLESAGIWVDNAAKRWAAFSENLRNADGGVYASLRESLDGLGVGFDRLIAALKPAYDALTQFFSGSISSSDVLQILSDVLGAAGLALQDMAAAIEWLIAKAAELGVFETVSGWFDSMSGSASELLPYITEFIGTFGAFAAVGLTVATGLGIVSTAVKALSAVLMVNPVVAIIAGIATAAYLLHEHWDAVAAWWDGLWGDVESAASDFLDWWNGTTLDEKRADIETLGIETGRELAEGFIRWWDGSLLKEWVTPVATAALDYAEQKANEFSVWWDSWTLQEVTADVTADVLIWAWEKAQAFSAWWASWHLLPKEGAVDISLIERAWEYVKSFKNWWDNLSLKSIVPDISISGAVEKAKAVGGDIISGLAQGINRAKDHITAASNAAAEIDPAMRAEVKTHSPSKVTEEIGSDVVSGLAVGIDKNASKAAKAASDAAAKVADAFDGIMQGLQKQFIELTQGDEAARRYELTQQKIVGANQEAVIALEAQIKAAEEQKKKTDENTRATEAAASAYKNTMERLQGQTIALTQGEEAGKRFELTQQKIVGANQDAVIAAQAHVKSLEEQKKKAEETASAIESAKKALEGSEQQLEIATKGLQMNDEQLQALTLSYKAGYNPAMAAAQAANEAKAKSLEQLRSAQIKANEAVTEAKEKLSIAQAAIGKTDEELRALVLTHEKGYTPALAKAQAATEAHTKTLESYRSDMQKLNQEQAVLEARLRGGEAAAKAVELGFKGYNAEQIKSIQGAEAFNQKLAASLELARGVGDALADALFSGNWKGAGQSILGQLKSTFIDPLKKSLSDAITQGLAGVNAGGLMGSIGKLLNFDGIKGALGGVGSSIGGLFSGIASSAANGFAGIGTAISGGLKGIMGSFGSLVSAVPMWGWALAGVAGLAKLFGGPSAPKINLTQGAKTGQGMLTDGQQHYTKTALGTVGATDASYKIGREKGFVPKLHEWFKWVESFDGMIAKTLPNSIGAISEALKGVEMKGANLEAFTRQRLHTIFSALPEALQVAIQGGKNIMAGTTEEIAARFNYMAQVAESGLIPALEQLGLAGNQSKESMIALAMGLADAMGGIDKAKAALDAYYQAAYTDAERLAMTQSAAKAKLDEYNKSLGLSGAQYIDSIAKLRARIDAEDASTAAGQKNIATLLGMVDALKTLSGTAEEAAAKLKQQWTDFNSAAYTDAQRENIAKKQAQKLVDQFNQTYGTALNNIIDARQLMRTIDTTTEGGKKMQQALLGLTGSLVTLGGTAEQIKQKIAGLKEGIKGLVGDLYGSKTTTTTATNTSAQTAAQSALDAANAALDSLRSRYDDEKQRIADLNNAAQEAYREELARYEQLKQLAVDLREYINGFKRSNALLTPVQKLQEIQTQYNATLAKAQTGDADAVKNIQGLADELRQSYLDVYASSRPSQDAIAKIVRDLSGLAITLDAGAGIAPSQPGTIGSTTLASLEQQISAQQSTISSLQAAVNSANSSANAATATADRAAMAKELATKIGELGLATDKSAWDILAKNGINIKDLATDFGINVSKLDATFISKTADLANRLNVNSLDLLTRLNVNFADLAKSFNIDVNNLNNGTLGKLDKLADQLKVSSVDLAAKLGINIDQLGNLMANKLASLPNIPADIRAGLAPHLQDIRNAADPATLQRELKELQAYVNTLPPGIRGQLNDQLQGILGYTGDTKANTADTKTETLALRSIRSSVDNTSAHTADLTAYTRDQVNAKGIQLALQNSRALNQHAASIGKAAIPSFAIGSDSLPRDMLANVHRGEMIFTAPQSQSMRDLAIYNQSVIPQIADYLSELAANDNQAPVFIQPVVTPAGRNNDNDELAQEMRRLRESNERLEKQLEKLRQERSQDALVDHEQRGVMINQNQASITNQEQARRDAWRDARKKEKAA